ncbi:hypothetical protein D9M69_302230 [compost metagenome]
MDFEEGFAVLGLVGLGEYLGRQLALLAEQHQGLVEFVGDDRADQEAAGVHGADVAEVGFDVTLDEAVGHHAQGPWRLEQGRDVAEYHAGFGEVRHGADQGFDGEFVEDHHRCLSAEYVVYRGNQPSMLPPAMAQSSMGSRMCTSLPSAAISWFCWKRVKTRDTVSTARPR